MLNDFRLFLPTPKFDSKLTQLILELDYLRKKELKGSTPKEMFFQLKEIFHLLESLGSARIEGNRTTIAEYIETKITPEKTPRDSIREIQNNEKAMDFVEKIFDEYPLNNQFIQEIHKIVVDGLMREGDKTPGEYRKENVSIQQSKHKPPDFTQVQSYMDEMFTLVSKDTVPQYDLLKTAVVHHRFAWVHPFSNGNGRTVRLLTYAMLIKQGFNLHYGRIVNPTAIFCSNRNQYYDFLSEADKGTEEGLLKWCEYVLNGLKDEVDKIDQLCDYEYLKNNILIPAIDYSQQQNFINDIEKKVLRIAVNKSIFQASDIKHLFQSVAHTEISRFLRNMKEKKLIKPLEKKARKYVMNISNGYLLRGIMKMLDKNNFLPIKGEV